MATHSRPYPRFSLCGLNCGLCPLFHVGPDSGCPGCGGEGQRACQIVRCAHENGTIEYCYQCAKYPCERYEQVSEFDSFISYRNVLDDFEKAKSEGIESYQHELDEKVEILRYLLENYNDGRKKTFFCTAVNLLALDDVKLVVEHITNSIEPSLPIKDKAKKSAQLFEDMAGKRNITLKLRRKK